LQIEKSAADRQSAPHPQCGLDGRRNAMLYPILALIVLLPVFFILAIARIDETH
jgi:hypothetical protein